MIDKRVPQAPGTLPIALWLGYAGLIPFVAGTALVWLLAPESRYLALAALSAYAAVIVSFLGGIHWGIGFRDHVPRLFVWGVLPSIAAAAALMLPPRYGLLMHGLMLLLCYGVDQRVYPAHGLQAWLGLRWRLSLIAATSCFVASAGG